MPVVVDADGLTHVAGPVGVPALLTPHAGELARMLGVEREQVEAEQLRFAREAAQRYDAVVLLKGRHTLVAAPDGQVRATTVGPAWLATAGAGDVLAGLCGALLAAGLDPFDAGSVGSWLHGAAARRRRPRRPGHRPRRRRAPSRRLLPLPPPTPDPARPGAVGADPARARRDRWRRGAPPDARTQRRPGTQMRLRSGVGGSGRRASARSLAG